MHLRRECKYQKVASCRILTYIFPSWCFRLAVHRKQCLRNTNVVCLVLCCDGDVNHDPLYIDSPPLWYGNCRQEQHICNRSKICVPFLFVFCQCFGVYMSFRWCSIFFFLLCLHRGFSRHKTYKKERKQNWTYTSSRNICFTYPLKIYISGYILNVWSFTLATLSRSSHSWAISESFLTLNALWPLETALGL